MVEIYTMPSYTTEDIDLKANQNHLEKFLPAFGFRKVDGSYRHKELGLYIDWHGEEANPLYESLGKSNAFLEKHGGKDGYEWARFILMNARAAGVELDRGCTDAIARKPDVDVYDLVEKLFAETPHG